MERPPHDRGLRARLARPVDGASLVVFRLCFGLILLWESWRYFSKGWITGHYVEPTFAFKYFGFSWVNALPAVGMYLVFGALALAAVGVALGYRYRLSASVLFIGWSYVFLLDATRYLNHIYLVCLLGAVMIAVPAHRMVSLDAGRRPGLHSSFVPTWALWLVRCQVAVPYVFGGLAKLNGDWLRGEPLRRWLAKDTDFPIIGRFFTEEWMILVFSYGGLALDLLVVPLLLWRRTRVVAYVAVAFFHLLNSELFTIGIFPWMMIGLTTIFFAPDWPRRFGRALGIDGTEPGPTPKFAPSRLATTLLCVWIALQLVIPLRRFLYPGNVSWTEQGHLYSWHMKLRSKTGHVIFTVTDPETGSSWAHDMTVDLTSKQASRMATHPDRILQYARFVAARLERQLGRRVEVRARAQVSLNGRPRRDMIDPDVDLVTRESSLWPADWILPLEEPEGTN